MKVHIIIGAKPNLIFLSETGINKFVPLQELAIQGYLLLIAKHSHLNCHGFSAYIKDGFHCDRDRKKQ